MESHVVFRQVTETSGCHLRTRDTVRRAIAVILALTVYSVAAQAEPLVLDRVHVVDVRTGTVAFDRAVVIEGGVILAVDPAGRAPQNARLYDGEGGYLISGLWDSHVHIFSTPEEADWALPLYLLHGITGIRDMGALWPLEEQKALQAAIAAGETLGPRLVLSGAWVDASPGSWPGMFLADTPAEARAVVHRIAAEGWAAVKAYSMLDEVTYDALAEAAKEQGLPLVGHIPERVTLPQAIEAGQVGMEHWGRVTRACAVREAETVEAMRKTIDGGADLQAIMALMAGHNRIVLDSWDDALCRGVLARMAKAEMHVSPTLVVADFYVGDRPGADALRMRALPEEVRVAWRRPDFRLEAMTNEVLDLAELSIALDRRTFLMAHEAGVPILASSDASFANPFIFHGASLLDELDLYVAAGLTPRAALVTATINPPRFLRLPDQDGVIAAGRRADLVLLDANPLDGLMALRRPRAVVANGRLLDRSALDAIEARLLERGRAEEIGRK